MTRDLEDRPRRAEVRVATRIEALLGAPRGQRFFCDDGHGWTEGCAKRPSMTHAEARNLSRNLRNALIRDGSESALAVAERLRCCSIENPCLLPSCVPCARAFQRAVVSVIEPLPGLREGRWCAVSVVPRGYGVPIGRLIGQDPIGDLADHIQSVLRRERLRCVVGIDMSHNWHQAGQLRDYYRSHGYMLMRDDAAEVRRRLRPYFPASRVVKRPLLVKTFDGSRAGIAYLMKPVFFQRQTLVRQLDEDGRPYGASTRTDDMRVAERVEIAIATARHLLADRLVIHGLDLIDDGQTARLALCR